MTKQIINNLRIFFQVLVLWAVFNTDSLTKELKYGNCGKWRNWFWKLLEFPKGRQLTRMALQSVYCWTQAALHCTMHTKCTCTPYTCTPYTHTHVRARMHMQSTRTRCIYIWIFCFFFCLRTRKIPFHKIVFRINIF